MTLPKHRRARVADPAEIPISSFILLLHYYIKYTADGHRHDLNHDLVQWPQQIPLAVEQDIFQFRSQQITIQLYNGRRCSRGHNAYHNNNPGPLENSTYWISGGEEIAVFDGKAGPGESPLWAGTVDPAEIKFDPTTKRLTLRILQHGAALATQYAGLPDWPASEDPTRRYVYKKRLDNWKNYYTPGGTIGSPVGDFTFPEQFHHAENMGETDVYYTPTAFESLDEGPLTQGWNKTWLYNTSNPQYCGAANSNFPRHFANVEGDWDEFVWHSPWKPHFHPDYGSDPADWETTETTNDEGSFVRNPDARDPNYSFPVTDIISDIVAQYNEQNRFPLTFDPDSAVIDPPPISPDFYLLPNSGHIDSVDWIEIGGDILLIINWDTYTLPLIGRTHIDFSLYRIVNGSQLIPLLDHELLDMEGECVWGRKSVKDRGLRFARTENTEGLAIFYMLTVAPQNPDLGDGYQFTWKAWLYDHLTHMLNDLIVTGTDTIDPPSSSYRGSADIYNYHIKFGGFPSSITLEQGVEEPPQLSLTTGGFSYRKQSGGIIASGAFFDSVALDYENTTLGKILTDLAIITDSIWWITPDRQLKFISRRHIGNDIYLEPDSLLLPVLITTADMSGQQIPAVSLGIKISDDHKQILDNYFNDIRFPESFTKSKITVKRPALIHYQDRIIYGDDDMSFGTDPLVSKMTLDGDHKLIIETRTRPTV